jgi:hypothetical protein
VVEAFRYECMKSDFLWLASGFACGLRVFREAIMIFNKVYAVSEGSFANRLEMLGGVF